MKNEACSLPGRAPVPLNPLLPLDVYVPDAEAHVWADGRIYLYGSFDLPGNGGYCSDVYHVYSSDDLLHWTDHGVSFSLAMTKDGWAKDLGALYAPDCAYRDGKYYLYYCVPDGRCGVAVSESPAGPFADCGPMAHVHGIDPAVLIDDDGQAWFYWGQFDAVRAARLRDNMTEIDPETAVQPLSVAEHEFHEGSSVKKIGGKYYYLFTDTHRHGGRATSLGYAVSDFPDHGFRYGGIVIDNFGCDPATWNNHGSLCEFRGQWYIFYHRSTHASVSSRHVCAEPIFFEDDGSIREVKMRSGILHGGEIIPACRAAELGGSVRIAGDGNSAFGAALTQIRCGDRALFRSVCFEEPCSRFSLTVQARGSCRAEIYLDGQYAGCAKIPPCASYTEVRGTLERPAAGTHEVEVRYYAAEDFTARMDGMTFLR
ncbi:MAG: family 43 glycosylhydrolase [Clostridiales bacterium]|nr:family 43 glycosylhydrolase [Clostridiales bacterium]